MPEIIERWKVVSPVATVNYSMNPSGEIAGNFSALGGASATRVTTYAKYGLYSYQVVTGANGDGISLTLSALPNESCFATARIRGKLPNKLRFIIGSGIKTPQLIERVDNYWSLYGIMFNATECNGRTELRIIQSGGGTGNFFVDGCQVENLEYWTTFCDGTQPGCKWLGTAHAAISIRSGQSREGGQVKDLYRDFNFFVDKVIGAGTPSQDLGVDEYALLPGGELNTIKIHPREWSLIGRFIADSDSELHQARKALIKLLRKDNRKQATKFLFYGPQDIKEIDCYYQSGLEGDMSVFYDSWVTEGDDKWSQLNKYIEKSAIQLKSTDPYFYKQGNQAVALDTSDSATFTYVAARLRSTGQWNNLGGVGTGAVQAFAEDSTYVYLGGDYINWGDANGDRVVRYNKLTGVFSSLDTGLDGTVWALAIGPDGRLYAGGTFTGKIAVWNGAAWAVLGGGLNNTVRGLAFGPSGLLYIVGDFTDAGGVANADYVATWNGAAYAAVGGIAGANNSIYGVAVSSDEKVYVVGNFTNIGGSAISYVAEFNGTAWVAMGSAPDNQGRGVAVAADGTVYAVGLWTTLGGVTVNYVGSWNGQIWSSMGGGLNNTGWSVAIGPDGSVFVGGTFTQAGDITITDRVARWNVSSWNHLDIDLPGSPTVYAILPSKIDIDPVIKNNYSLWVGFSTTGAGNYGGKVTATNSGSSDSFPKIIFNRSGGTSATIASVKNETTGKELLFSYALKDGETLTVNLKPGNKSIISSMYGSILSAIRASCDFGTFVLEPDNNDITAFVINNGATVTAQMEWSEVYESFD